MDPIVRPAWMTQVMYDEWLRLYADAGGSGVAGSADTATTQFRDLPQYEDWFPGIRREDGALRYANNPEATYFNNIAAYRNTIEGLGMDMNPDIFNEDFISLIEGDTSPDEFEQRVNTFYDRVLQAGDDTRAWYADSLGIDMTNQALIASLMSERIEGAVFSKQITMAEIGGAAMLNDYDLSSEFVTLLEQAGMERDKAQKFFGTADSILPILGVLASRHGDPDDTFDIMELAQADVLMDAKQTRRIGSLVAQEQSTFTGGKQIEYESNQAGGVTGLDTV
jgi:hypothetical protein